MRKISFSIFVGVVFCALINSCRKEEGIEKRGGNQNLDNCSSFNSQLGIITNTNVEKKVFINPFNDFGIKHNEILKQFELRAAKLTSRKDFFDVGIEFMNNSYKSNITISYSEVENALNNSLNSSITSLATKLKNKLTINTIQYNYLVELDLLLNSSTIVNNAINGIDRFDLKLFSDKKINDQEKEILFKASAVAKNSLVFWNRKSEEYLSSGIKGLCNKPFCITTFDVVGVITGVVTLPNTGAAGGIVFGALASAIGKCCFCCPGSCSNVSGLCD